MASNRSRSFLAQARLHPKSRCRNERRIDTRCRWGGRACSSSVLLRRQLVFRGRGPFPREAWFLFFLLNKNRLSWGVWEAEGAFLCSARRPEEKHSIRMPLHLAGGIFAVRAGQSGNLSEGDKRDSKDDNSHGRFMRQKKGRPNTARQRKKTLRVPSRTVSLLRSGASAWDSAQKNPASWVGLVSCPYPDHHGPPANPGEKRGVRRGLRGR